jgi:hypothetical protein
MNFKASRQINDVCDFNEAATMIFEEFLETFTKENGLLRDVNEEDTEGEYFSFMYTDRGGTLARRMLDRLCRVGGKYFDELDIEISTYLFVEP